MSMCLLTNFTAAIPIPDKSDKTIVQPHNMYMPPWWFSYLYHRQWQRIKKELFQNVVQEWGIKNQFSSPSHPQSNAILEKFHLFFKSLHSKAYTWETRWEDTLLTTCTF